MNICLGIHLAVDRDTSFNFPEANRLPLPSNIDSHESTRFSPLRSQNVVTSNQITVTQKILDVTLTQKPEEDKPFVNLLSEDHCLKGYECHGFNLSSAMQSTVPEAFNNNNNNVSYLHFPGGGKEKSNTFLTLFRLFNL